MSNKTRTYVSPSWSSFLACRRSGDRDVRRRCCVVKVIFLVKAVFCRAFPSTLSLRILRKACDQTRKLIFLLLVISNPLMSYYLQSTVRARLESHQQCSAATSGRAKTSKRPTIFPKVLWEQQHRASVAVEASNKRPVLSRDARRTSTLRQSDACSLANGCAYNNNLVSSIIPRFRRISQTSDDILTLADHSSESVPKQRGAGNLIQAVAATPTI